MAVKVLILCNFVNSVVLCYVPGAHIRYITVLGVFQFLLLQFGSLLSDFIFRDKPFLFFFDLLQCAKMGPSVVLGCPTPQVGSLCCYPAGVFLPWHSVVVGCPTPQVGSVCCNLDPVDVHCLMISDPVYACRYHPVNVHGLIVMISAPVCACAYYPVSVYWSWMTFCAPLHAVVLVFAGWWWVTLGVFIVYSWMTLCVHYTLRVFIA